MWRHVALNSKDPGDQLSAYQNAIEALEVSSLSVLCVLFVLCVVCIVCAVCVACVVVIAGQVQACLQCDLL